MEVNTDWVSLRILICYGPEKAKDQRKIKQNCETLSKVECTQISYISNILYKFQTSCITCYWVCLLYRRQF